MQIQKYFQKLVDLAYDFKLYQKPNDKVSIRTFCTNNDKAYVAVEETYCDISYNGHAKKDEKYRNNMTNFGILMEICQFYLSNGRSFELFDILANIIGSILGMILFKKFI